ncbi:MAG: transcriptional regulator [Nitrospinae bacterium]|nr:transcriptional regulator [Nitrospinota bacterium]
MALTKDFKETIQSRVQKDPEFREALFKESIQCLLSGDMETGKSLLRDYINATIGFEELSGLIHKSPKSLMRMLSPKGNPQARNLFDMISLLQKIEGMKLEIQSSQ